MLVNREMMNVDDDDDDTTNIYSFSDSDNNLNQINQIWGTWEELVLTCAVKRYGFMDWDSIAKEVQLRCSITVSAGNCKVKYRDLKRRFLDSGDEAEDSEIPWIEELRNLRVEELRREVQRCDDSILSLQLKVKKLEEEKDGEDRDNKPDLEEEDDDSKPANNETEPVKLNRDTTESDRDNRSMNESNSTASVDKIIVDLRDKPVQACESSRNPEPDPVYKAAAEKEEQETVSKGSEMSHSNVSGTFTGRGKRKRRSYRSGEDSSIGGGSGGDIKSVCDKSQPLIDIIELIRSHPRGSWFDTRLRSQETKDYKRLIRQHMDIKTIEKKLEKGAYVSSNLCFYRDLKLLLTNAKVFFPPSSSESIAAQELRTLVSKEIKKVTRKLNQNVIKVDDADESSVFSKQKSYVPSLVVCKKKSSSNSKQKDEKKSQEVCTSIGTRSSKRTKNNNKKQTDDDDEKEETLKIEKKTVSDKKKSVANFLKRIKKSDENVKKENKQRELRSNSMSKKKVKVENDSNKCSSKRKQLKKEEEVRGKRGREFEKENNKQPNKRRRR